MITKVFDRSDNELYTTWHMEDGGVVCLVVPGVGEVRMTAAKAEEISGTMKMHAEYTRMAMGDTDEQNSNSRE